LVGFIGSGKGTVADILAEKGCVTNSFAAPLKDAVACIFGWPRHLLEGDTIESRDFRETPDMFWSRKTGISNFTPRLALQLIGTDVMRKYFHEDIWLSSFEYRIHCNHSEHRSIVISDARFRNELELIKKLNGKIVWIQRGELPEWYDVAVDANQGNVVSEKIMKTRYSSVHRSEWDWAGFPADYVVHNDTTIDNLRSNIDTMISDLKVNLLRVV
jgi:hypothetical protein